MLSAEKLAEGGPWNGATLVAPSTAAQELLGMQRADREARYRYALPVLDSRFKFHSEASPDHFFRWAAEHAKHAPVSKHTDGLVVPASRLRGESRELGHEAITIAHATGQDRLFRAYASRALRPKQLRKVLEKWELLRSEVEEVLPLDADIATCAVGLANQFVASGLRVKGTARNTMNDMFVAATSLMEGIPLVTDDTQLKAFYRELGWTVSSGDGLFIAAPTLPPDRQRPGNDQAPRGNRYANRPLNLRRHVGQSPPPLR